MVVDRFPARPWRCGYLIVGAVALLLGPTPAVSSAAEPDELETAEKTLKEAKLPVDGPGLLTYFRQRTLSEADQKKLAGIIAKLGADDFNVRLKAFRELQAAGRMARPFLMEALKDPDQEIVGSAKTLLKQLDDGSDLALAAAAAKVLAARKPEGTVAVLLAYLPLAQDDVLEEAIYSTLATVGVNNGKPDPLVVAALSDKLPVRRLAAVHALSNAGPGQRPAVRAALKDTDARVRFLAATSLIKARDKTGVDAVIAFLDEGPQEMAWQSLDLLCRIAGENRPALLEGDDEAARRACRKKWEDWWKTSAAKIDLAKISLEKTLLGLTVICEYDGGDGQGRIWVCRADGKQRQEIRGGLGGPLDAHQLPNGNFLVAEYSGRRVTERNKDNKIVWQHNMNNSVLSCERLPNGNTLIASMSEVREVTRDGKTVFSLTKPTVYYATRLANKHTLYIDANRIVEVDGAGKELKSINLQGIGWGSVEKLRNGNYLAALYGGQRVVEVDGTGKVVWSVNVGSPSQAIRLPNGNTLVASVENRFVAEYNRAGKEVWKKQSMGRTWRVRRH
jgi:hypothetical protein